LPQLQVFELVYGYYKAQKVYQGKVPSYATRTLAIHAFINSWSVQIGTFPEITFEECLPIVLNFSIATEQLVFHVQWVLQNCFNNLWNCTFMWSSATDFP